MTIEIAVYDLNTGKIKSFCGGEAPDIFSSVGGGEDYLINCPQNATHVFDGVPAVISDTYDEKLIKIRATRNALLRSCDWTQTSDFPYSIELKTQWAVYRQELRDFMGTCNADNPVWPVVPTKESN